MEPLIGISGSIDDQEYKQYTPRVYLKSSLKAGIIPTILSMDMNEEQITSCFYRLDGLLLTGGNDLDPLLFGESPVQAIMQVDPLRDRFEMMLVKEAYKRAMPVFAICRGLQTLNVALGGTLYQDLPTQYTASDGGQAILHKQTAPPQEPCHRVQFTAGSPLIDIYGRDRIKVNSLHHQAIKTPAERLTVCAAAEDGVIEAVYDASMPFVWGVQWHPERMADGAPLFKAFARACALYAARKEC
ncbi:MAG: gamma-glutamyl-gamma-aminobutyrate hydrolase family protein [Eubacteriales bacterium]|nr:gamma-glutamyl-gamma-aminobutyrate hydrolase family protein [Eubacteriales bacterium]